MNRILAGYDGDAGDRAPVDFGALVSRHTGAPLVVVSVHAASAPFTPLGHDIVNAEEHEDTGRRLARLRSDLAAAGTRAECVARPGASPARELHDAAHEYVAGMLVVGSSQRGGVRRLMSSPTAERLLHGAPCPVAVVPRAWEPGGGLRTVGAAFEDTPEGRDALVSAAAIARRFGARVRVISALKTDDDAAGVRLAATRALAGSQDAEQELDFDLVVGDPADVLVAASERVELLVCGSRGYGPKQAVLVGGVSRRVTAEAHCPVIVLPRGASKGLQGLGADRSAAQA